MYEMIERLNKKLSAAIGVIATALEERKEDYFALIARIAEQEWKIDQLEKEIIAIKNRLRMK